MPMTFEEAEAKFRQLQARVQRGESISRAEYEEEVGKLAVQDRNGTLWEINPRTGKWMYFDGAEWVSGAPPGHDTSTVMPVPKEILGAKAPPPTSPPARPAAPSGATTARVAPAPPPFVRTGQKPAQPTRPRAPAMPPPGAPPGERLARQGSAGGRNREWVPLAIGAVVLFFCAIILLVSATFVLPLLSPKPTPTRALTPTRSAPLLLPATTMPTSTPPPTTAPPVMAKVSGDSANVRSKPSTSGTIIVKLKKDQQITLVAKGPADGANVWYQLNIPDKPGPAWIRSDTIQIISGDPNALPLAGAATPGVVSPPTPKAYP